MVKRSIISVQLLIIAQHFYICKKTLVGLHIRENAVEMR